MKKYILLLCMITCIFGLTACGDELSSVKESTRQNQEAAEVLTTDVIIPYMEEMFFDQSKADEYVEEYNVYEIEALVGADLNALIKDSGIIEDREMHVIGNSMLAGITSFSEAFSEIGEIEEIKIIKNTYASEEIHIEASVIGSKANATAVFIYADDIFLTLESIALTQDQTISELLQKAVYDTIMGIGSVFTVLLLICFIISMFGFIPKLLGAKKEKENVAAPVVVDKPIAQIIEKEELSDDTELVAVIAAAIAASEGYVSTDGFFVRSIRKANKNR